MASANNASARGANEWWEELVLFVVVAHVVLCPFSKVEESFNTQAVHDALFVEDLGAWDHRTYPGTVPRTFLGALAVAAVYNAASLVHAPLARLCPRASGAALRWLAGAAPPDGPPLLAKQVLARLALAALWFYGFRRFAGGARRRFGRGAAAWLCALSAAQFHGPFYASRFLPNSLAMPLVLYAYGEGLSGRRGRGLALIGAATAAVRCDLLALAAPLGAAWCLRPSGERAPLLAVGVPCALLGAGVAAALSVGADTYLWASETWLWPEGAVLLYNNPSDGRSSAWGTLPAHWYATSALPRALGGALPLAALGMAYEPARCGADLGLPAVASVGLLSLLPHKELRFVFPALPLLTLCAAVGADRLWRRDAKRIKRAGPRALIRRSVPLGLAALTLGAAVLFSAAARNNYPGGVALRALHDRWGGDLGHAAIVHVDDRAATSGVSRFGEEMRGSGWTYDKRDGLLDFDAFDYRLAELPLAGDAADFDVLAEVYAYAGLKPDEAFPFLKMETAPAIAILRHKRHRGVRVPEPLRISA